MFGIRTRRLAAIGLLLGLGGVAAAGAGTSIYASGTVSGWNTVDYVNFAANQGQTIHYYVSGSGSGSNKLTCKIQQQKSGGDWKTLVTEKMDMPSGGNWGTFVVEDQFGSVGELCRLKFSRDLGTSSIDWVVEYLY